MFNTGLTNNINNIHAEFTEDPSLADVVLGYPLSLMCTVSGTPTALSWYKDGTPITAGANLDVSKNKDIIK